MDRPQPARHGARAAQKARVLRSSRGTRALLFRRVCPKLARKQLTGWVAGLFVYAHGHQKAPPVPYLGRVRCVWFGSANLDAPGWPPGRMTAGVVPSWHGRFLVEIEAVGPTSTPTEGEVPPAGCAGVVCANETNKKKTKWRAFSLLRIAGERGRRGGCSHKI